MAEKKLYEKGDHPDSGLQKALEKFKRESPWGVSDVEEPTEANNDVDFQETGITKTTEPNLSSDPGLMQKITIPGYAIGADGKKKDVEIDYGDPEVDIKVYNALTGQQAALNQGAKKQAVGVEPKNNSLKLASFVKEYLQEYRNTNSWTEKTYEENKAIFQLLKEVLGNPSVETICYQHSNEFKKVLLKLPPNRTKGSYAGMTVKQIIAKRPNKKMSPSTVNKYLRRCSSMFDWGKRHGHVIENHFSGISIKQKKQAHTERERFSMNDLSLLFSPDYFNKEKFKHSYCYWLPLLGLYTGARLEELCQLHLEDIREEKGVWVLDINDNGKNGEKRVKTPSSKRLVPLHPKLLEIGFLHHVEALRQKKAVRLFPELKKQRDGYSQSASKWFGRYRKRCGVNPPFHSFRHTFIDELLQAGAEEKKVSAVVGHANESETGGRYGKPFRPDVLYPVVCKLELHF